MVRVFKKCEVCNVKVKKLWERRGKMRCWNCYAKTTRKIGTKTIMTMEEALKKVYNVKGYSWITKDGTHVIRCSISVPIVLAEYKVKLVLADDSREAGDNSLSNH